MSNTKVQDYAATQNPCKLCTPFGACLAFSGIAGAVPFVHGSQGCSTYIRRYMINHFREPVDIACSNFDENTAVFGGGDNFRRGILNVINQYHPEVIGLCTTCLTETIGDDMKGFIRSLKKEFPEGSLPHLIPVSTPSYQGSYTDGFQRTIKATVEMLATCGKAGKHINIFPGMVSPEDIRHLKEVFVEFGIKAVILPDISDSMDGQIWNEYESNIKYGTSVADIESTGTAKATIEFGTTRTSTTSAGGYLLKQYGISFYEIDMPIGLRLTDTFFERLESISGVKIPEKYVAQRGRLIDTYVDGHKYLFGKKALIYGPEDLVISMASFVAETGIEPVICASGDKSGQLYERLGVLLPEKIKSIKVMEDVDFMDIEEVANQIGVDIMIGSSKGLSLSRKLEVPLIRVGFPVHDRIGASRIMHLGYHGTTQLYDRIANAFIERKQDKSDVGYSHL